MEEKEKESSSMVKKGEKEVHCIMTFLSSPLFEL